MITLRQLFRNPNTQKSFECDKKMWLGSDSTRDDFAISDDDSVAYNHASIIMSGPFFILRPERGKTKVNSHISHLNENGEEGRRDYEINCPTSLNSGDVIKVGDTMLLVLLGDEKDLETEDFLDDDFWRHNDPDYEFSESNPDQESLDSYEILCQAERLFDTAMGRYLSIEASVFTDLEVATKHCEEAADKYSVLAFAAARRFAKNKKML